VYCVAFPWLTLFKKKTMPLGDLRQLLICLELLHIPFVRVLYPTPFLSPSLSIFSTALSEILKKMNFAFIF
jgi:hypothetical protein